MNARDVIIQELSQSEWSKEDADSILFALREMPLAARLAFAREIAGGDWAVVPREPTREMWRNAADALVKDPHGAGSGAHHDHISGLVWNAMLAASEKEPGQ